MAGILTHLLFWPVTGPWAVFEWSMNKALKVAEDELTDDTAVKQELMELQMLLELGDIDDEEYVRRERVLMDRLRDVRYWREQFGRPVAGGPVRVAQSGEAGAGGDGGAEGAPAG